MCLPVVFSWHNNSMRYHRSCPEISLAGLGTTQFWSGASAEALACFPHAIETYGVTLIDTAEMYADGRCESRAAEALRHFERDAYFLLGKVHPHSVEKGRLRQSVTDSLARMKTDYFDLYLLHWRENVRLDEFVAQIEEIRKEGLIRRWGVSNFDMRDMNDLLAVPGSENCFCNQILYNLMTRGPEYDLLPFLREKGIMPMAYSSLGSSFRSDRSVKNNPVIQEICRENGISHQALMLAFITRFNDIPALFSTSSRKHLESNLAFADFDIMPYMDRIDREFPPPDHAEPLDKI